MITLRHPFASAQCVRYSLSTDALSSWLRLTPTDADVSPGSGQPQPPQPDPPPLRRTSSQQPQNARKIWPKLDVNVPGAILRSSSGHFVKHSSKVTLLLSGQAPGVIEPEYTNAATIEGILAVARPSGLLSLEVKVSAPASPSCAPTKVDRLKEP
jgi:hypothetical protein